MISDSGLSLWNSGFPLSNCVVIRTVPVERICEIHPHWLFAFLSPKGRQPSPKFTTTMTMKSQENNEFHCITCKFVIRRPSRTLWPVVMMLLCILSIYTASKVALAVSLYSRFSYTHDCLNMPTVPSNQSCSSNGLLKGITTIIALDICNVYHLQVLVSMWKAVFVVG